MKALLFSIIKKAAILSFYLLFKENIMRKQVVSMLLAVILLLSSAAYFAPFADAAEAGLGYYVITSSNGLNMRSQPSSSGTKITLLPNGAVVNVTQISNGWGYTSYGSHSGWISLTYATKTTEPGAVNVFAKLDELRVKFPAGAYWNTVGGADDPDLVTNSPCTCHPHGGGKPFWVEGCTCKKFMGTSQCHGFALKIGYDLYGTNPDRWTKKKNTLDGLCVGDLIRLENWHTIVVTGISADGNYLYICDGNWDYSCGIDWDRAFSVSRILSHSAGFYVLHHPDNTNYVTYDGSAPSVSATASLDASANTVSVNASLSDNKGLSYVNVEITSPTGKKQTKVFENPTNSFSAKINLDHAVETGEYKVVVTAYDVAGNKKSSTATATHTTTTTSTTTTTTTTTTTSTSTTGSTTTTTTIAAPPSGSIDITQFVDLVRLGGETRIETAIKIAKEGWGRGAEAVIIANGLSFADALAGVPLAYALDAPILLTANAASGIESSVLDEIRELGVKKIYILGGESAVGKTIEGQLDELAAVERIYGGTRFETSVKIAQKLETFSRRDVDEVFITYAYNFPDALSAGAAAAKLSAPIIYVDKSGILDEASAEYLAASDIDSAYIIGGAAVIDYQITAELEKVGINKTNRIGGNDRYSTSALICEEFSYLFSRDAVALATGTSFPDALAGAVLAAKYSVPIVLAVNDPENDAAEYVRNLDVDKVYVFGGKSVVPDSVVAMYVID